MELKFGLDTFGDMQNDDNGQPNHAAQVIRNLVDQAVLADELGIAIHRSIHCLFPCRAKIIEK